MATMKPCKTCEREISTDADACPGCGDSSPHGVRRAQPPVVVKSRGGGSGCVGGLLFLVAIVVVLGLIGGSDEDESPATRTTFSEADKAKGFHCLEKWDGSHAAFKYEVRSRMRNPKSFEHIETRIVPVGDDGMHTVSMRYRSENGFGGMNEGLALAEVRNSDCTHIIRATDYDGG